ncbi:uncharacterized protein LOC117220000 [Megalopta genalis]|uniref:uncharacterized protein LOC117220000 n=1 Tax=Megalopta genalis TaxID=115081 RepID=UPI00144341E3|nr:uncharacterized protein LOC117220000 [Megalopta genalis]XP_033325493.1 uncharacterized protein LOC117220000 [Megalopta genalis]
MDFQSMLTDLGAKMPSIQYILRPEFAPYLNTAGTVLLGWLIVSWISYVLWTLLAPLMMGAAAIFLLCPATAKWCVKQTIPGVEVTLNDFLEKIQSSLCVLANATMKMDLSRKC